MISTKFRRVLRPVTGILNECWQTEVLDLDIDPGRPFSTIRKLHLYCAGGPSAPDPDALNWAKIYITQLGPVIGALYRKLHSADCDFEPCLRAVFVPHQQIGLYFVDFLSEYGIAGAHAIKTSDCKFGTSGIYPLNGSNFIVADVIGVVQSVLNEIFDSISHQEAASLKSWISTEKIMGPEIVSDLVSFLETKRSQFVEADTMMESLIEAGRFLENAG